MNVKINGKNYTVPQMGFQEMAAMENIAETSIITVFQKQQVFVLAEAFVGVVAGCDKAEAGRLCEQHILGGGKLDEIYAAFVEAVNESGFFRKLLGMENGRKTNVEGSQTVAK